MNFTALFAKLSTLQWALLVSLGLHAGLLTFRFVDPEGFDRVWRDTPLDIILVNARSDEPPDKALALAQVSLNGGGEAEQGRATSPLPPAPQAQSGDAVEPDSDATQMLQRRQTELLASLRAQIAALPPPQAHTEASGDEAIAREARRQALVSLLAEIEKRIQAENARPRKRFVSPSTREVAYATYYDAVRRKIEDHGTRHFPEDSGRKLYGELTMVFTIDRSGRVLGTEVVQGSGQPALDRRSEAIVQSLRFDTFSERMRQHADQLVVVSRFRFARDQAVQAQVSSQ